jgi:hypothetical protein
MAQSARPTYVVAHERAALIVVLLMVHLATPVSSPSDRGDDG